MQSLFEPSSVAVIGASEKTGTVGQVLFKNALQSPIPIYAVNIAHKQVMGRVAYGAITDIEEAVEVALIAIRAAEVPKAVKACRKKGVKHIIVISDGFRNVGQPEGWAWEAEMLQQAQQSNIRILGPNCWGLMNLHAGINLSMANEVPEKGNVAFISQSGALCNAILSWGKERKVGFSHFISIGGMLDIGWADLLLHLDEDPHTKAILLYMETIKEVRNFISAAREVAFDKPIIVLKGGITPEAVKAAISHTGSVPSDDALFNAAFRRCGVLRVDTLGELFFMASFLEKMPVPKGNRLSIVTNSGGSAVLCTDALLQGGGQLAEIGSEAEQTLNAFSEEKNKSWLLVHPLDIRRDATVQEYQFAMEALLQDPENDGVLVIITPQMRVLTIDQIEQGLVKVAKVIRDLAKKYKKPVLVNLLGGENVKKAAEVLDEADIPTISFPDVAARVFNYLWKFGYNLKGLYETPEAASLEISEEVKAQNKTLLQEWRESGKLQIGFTDAAQILESYQLPVVAIREAQSYADMLEVVRSLEFPVAVSPSNSHNPNDNWYIYTPEALERCYQQINNDHPGSAFLIRKIDYRKGLPLCIGSQTDEQFGTVLYLGNGSELAELYPDRSWALPPLNTTLAKRMLEQTKLYCEADWKAHYSENVIKEIQSLLVALSELVLDLPCIREVKLNKVAISAYGVCIENAELILFEPEEENHFPEPAILPYPGQYRQVLQMKDGSQLVSRPIRPEDEHLVVEFHRTLSEKSVYYRYFYPASFDFRASHERLARICFIDYDREMTLVALEEGENPRMLGAGRLVRTQRKEEAEISLTISDLAQGKGLGKQLMKQLVNIAKDMGFALITAEILAENKAMRHICQQLGFSESHTDSGNSVTVRLGL